MAGNKVVQMVGASYHLSDRKAAVQSAINCFPQRLDGDQWMMASAPGEVPVASMPGPARGFRLVGARFFMVFGDTLYEMMADGLIITIGTLASTDGPVGMADNKTQLAIVDGPSLYILTISTNTLVRISAPGWRGSNNVHELDGYFIFVDPGTDQFYLSAIDDGSNLNALDFSSADSAPDDIVTHIVSHRQAWFFGQLSAEIWVDSGESSFPFVRYQSYTLDIGCVGTRAVIMAADTIFWVGQTRAGRGIVYMASGNQPQRVSTMAVEEALRGSTDISAVEMWAYQVEGHEFVAINAPGLSSTWVYDAALQQWHERAEWDAQWEPLRSRFVTAFNGQHYAGDSDGKLVMLASGVNTLSGRPLVRERTWPHFVQQNMEPVSYRGLELAMATGHGGNVTLEISNDGGWTFGPPLMRSLGVIGRWMQRVRWLNLGTAINRVFRIRCSDDVPFAVHSASVDT